MINLPLRNIGWKGGGATEGGEGGMGEVRVDERQMSCTRGSHKMTLVMQASHDTFVVTGEKAEAEKAI